MHKTHFPKSFKIFLIISLGLHGVALLLLLWNWATDPFYWGGGLSGRPGVVTVVLMSPEAGSGTKDEGRRTKDEEIQKVKTSKEAKLKVVKIPEPKKKSAQKGKESGIRDKAVSQSSKKSRGDSAGKEVAMTRPGYGVGDSPTPAGGTGGGYDAAHGASGAPDVLALIRQKILKSKSYPLSARRRGIEGTVRVKFKMNQSGALQTVSVIGSSGSSLLDQEAVATVKRAAPYPYFAGEITMGMKFDLQE